jgi:uncharacterized LabA/DUF88 family protein
MTGSTAALFLDFDNFFSGLMEADPESALALVASPSRWLQKLRTTHTNSDERRWLVLRCYMNPAGSLQDPRKPGERLYFSKFRPSFTQAGVEVVDCPALTKKAKNGADIRIVIDVMTALKANTRYDEFVIASADADFTPLLQVLRADDRRVTVISTSSTATAYESLADRFLDEQDIFDLMSIDSVSDASIDTDEPGGEVGVPLPPLASMSKPADGTAGFEHFAATVRAAYLEATRPLLLSQLSSSLETTEGTNSQWFGAGTFVRAIRLLDLPDVRISTLHLWDETRHEQPKSSLPFTLPTTVAQFAQVTGMPRISTDHWPVVYQNLALYAATHSFNLTEASKWPRDQATQAGHDVPRAAFTFTVKACHEQGVHLYREPTPAAADIARALYDTVLRRAEVAGLEVSQSEKCELAAWIHHDEPDCRELPPLTS